MFFGTIFLNIFFFLAFISYAVNAGIIINPPAGGSGSTTWGNITGTLSSQTDLQSALDGKLGTSLADGKIYVGNSGGTAEAVTPSGDVTISNSGVTSYNGVLSLAKGGWGISNAPSDISSTGSITISPTTSFVRLTGNATTTIIGITAPSTSGTRVSLYVLNNITCSAAHENGSATAANRLALPGSTALTMQRGNAYSFVYDGGQSRWVFEGGYPLVNGTTNQINVSNSGGVQTLSLPQNIHTSATPQFTGLVGASGPVIDLTTGRLTDFSSVLVYDIASGGIGHASDGRAFSQIDRILIGAGGTDTSIDWSDATMPSFPNISLRSPGSGTGNINNLPDAVAALGEAPSTYVKFLFQGSEYVIPAWATE